MSNSLAVTVANDQSAMPVNVSLPTTIYNNVVNVTNAGTRVQFPNQAILSMVTIKAKIGNAGTIYVGNSTVAASNGYQLSPGDSIPVEVANLNLIYIDAANNGDGVSWVAS